MLGIDRKAAHYTWTAAAVLALLALIYQVRTTVFIFVLALLFAYLLSPLVNLLDRVLPTNRTRPLALALAYVIFIGVAVLIGIQIGGRAVEQARTLGKQFPAMLAKWEQPSQNASPEVNSLKGQIVEKVRTELARRSGDIITMLGEAGVKVLTVASEIVYVVVIPILAFFFLKDGAVMRQHILELVESSSHRALLNDVMADIHLLLAHYMRALMVLSLAAFTAYAIFFSIVGVPYGILLAALGGILEFVPMIGPLTAGVTIVLVSAIADAGRAASTAGAASANNGAHILAVIIFLLAYRVFQDYILSPHLMGQGVELHPLMVLFGVFAGAEFAGIAGAFLSVPVLAMVRILYVRFRKSRLQIQAVPESVNTPV